MKFSDTPDDTNASRARYALGAWLIAVVPSLLYFFVLVGVGADSMRPIRAFDAVHVAYSILAAPVLETALMLPVALVLAQMVPWRPWVRIILLAAFGALAHRIGGGWEQVIASFWPFLVYSVTLNAWLRHSKRAAFSLTSVVHALYNATFFGIGALGILLTNPVTRAS